MLEIEFDWALWNIQKNELQHGVSRMEAESVFFDPGYQMFKDMKHSSPREERFVLFGRSIENRVLMVGFTIRPPKIRIITARPASKRERNIYGH